jgi:hypothetical protein
MGLLAARPGGSGTLSEEGNTRMPAFLSEEWFEKAKEIRDSVGEVEPPAAMKDVVINIVVTGGPEGDKEVHMNSGNFDVGLVDDAPTKLTVPYDVARKVFIEGDQQAAMQAFMQGQVKVEGDMTKIMAMQAGGPPSPAMQELQKQIAEMTD